MSSSSLPSTTTMAAISSASASSATAAAACRRTVVRIVAPATGRLGIKIGSPPDNGTDGHCSIIGIESNSSLTGQVCVGDWISRINTIAVQNKSPDYVTQLLLLLIGNNGNNTLTVLRDTTSTSSSSSSTTAGATTTGIAGSATGTGTAGSSSIRSNNTNANNNDENDPPTIHQHNASSSSSSSNNKDVIDLTGDDSPKKPPPRLPASSASAAAAANNKRPSFSSPSSVAQKKPKSPAKKTKKKTTAATTKTKHNNSINKVHTLNLRPDQIPYPGTVDAKCQYYSTLDDETLSGVAEKLGVADWKIMAKLNQKLYGPLKSSSIFKPNTLLIIPKDRSQWKMKLLQPQEEALCESALVAGRTHIDACVDCGIVYNNDIPQQQLDDMLLCDGCDGRHHLRCVGLADVPAGDWFCTDCTIILKARKAAASGSSSSCSNIPYNLPKLPPLDNQQQLITSLRINLKNYWRRRRTEELSALQDNYAVAKQACRDRKIDLEKQVRTTQRQVSNAHRTYTGAKKHAMVQHGIASYDMHRSCHLNTITIRLPNNGGNLHLRESNEIISTASAGTRRVMSERWNRAVQARNNVKRSTSTHKSSWTDLSKKLDGLKKSITQENDEAYNLARSEAYERKQLEVLYATRLNEPKLDHETMAEYNKRKAGDVPHYIGTVQLVEEGDVFAMNFLREPTELIVLVPMLANNNINIVDNSMWMEPRVGMSYGVFANDVLFSKTRDDKQLPMERLGVRDAQRRLFTLLESNNSNNGLVISSPSIPSTVKLRGGDTEHNNIGDHQYFDLSELVRDCNVDLDLPQEPTPSSMKDVQLRDYQQSSLRWMLDKERSNSTMGLAGELWHRLRFLDPICSNQDYFYCELTGSFALDVFDYREDVAQRDASINRFAMPTGGVLGEEMGLGKTVIAISVMVANPPPLHLRVLPREHHWSLEGGHPDYTPLPDVGGSSRRLSNGTLVIVPMTLLSQWVTEIERFAPHMSITTLHNAESATINDVATSDVVIASTFLLQSQTQTGKKKGKRSSLLGVVKRIHWHRIIVDEAHYNQQGQTTKNVIATLSATHRVAVTGTPIGAQLSDLYGQLRFLRLAPFCRPDFWKNNVEDPYYERNLESLRVLRSLLSRIVIRHSKDQTLTSGANLLTLPPRTVETVHLQFGSEAEQEVYKTIDKRNLARINELKRDSRSKVTSHYFELQGRLAAARQACAHTSLINLDKLNSSASSTAKKESGDSASNTRDGIFQLALERARPSARLRMGVLLYKCQQGEYLECPICFDLVGECDIAVPACAHPFCGECILELLNAGGRHREASGQCPTCRDTMVRSEITFLGDANDAGTQIEKKQDEDMAPTVSNRHAFQLTANDVRVSVTNASSLRVGHRSMTADALRQTLQDDRAFLPSLDSDFLTNFYKSESQVGSKISELLTEVEAMIARDPKSKCVVFTQFLGVLDVAAEELRARGIGYCRIDGNCKQHERADALMEFNSNPNMKVFLLSMRSGAVGLTLTAADHCFIMDTALNSAIEEQAIDRIHRIGQTRPVTVKRFVMQGSVEERLLGVRRSLGVDRTAAGTQISGTNLLAAEEAECSTTNNYLRSPLDGSDDAKRQQRIEMLEKLFGCSSTVNRA